MYFEVSRRFLVNILVVDNFVGYVCSVLLVKDYLVDIKLYIVYFLVLYIQDYLE